MSAPTLATRVPLGSRLSGAVFLAAFHALPVAFIIWKVVGG